jgi:hypothetical protein
MVTQPDSTGGDEKAGIACLLCDSEKQERFVAEINVHFSGSENIGNPGVLFLPKLLVCLDCGFSRFTTPETELALLAGREN